MAPEMFSNTGIANTAPGELLSCLLQFETADMHVVFHVIMNTLIGPDVLEQGWGRTL